MRFLRSNKSCICINGHGIAGECGVCGGGRMVRVLRVAESKERQNER